MNIWFKSKLHRNIAHAYLNNTTYVQTRYFPKLEHTSIMFQIKADWTVFQTPKFMCDNWSDATEIMHITICRACLDAAAYSKKMQIMD